MHDPYLNTVKRSLQDKYYKERNSKKKETQQNFLRKEIHISDYINLSENSINTLLLITFVFLPYTTGIAFIFFVIARASLEVFEGINLTDYLVYWAIGYEILASILILIIIKSAIGFKVK